MDNTEQEQIDQEFMKNLQDTENGNFSPEDDLVLNLVAGIVRYQKMTNKSINFNDFYKIILQKENKQ